MNSIILVLILLVGMAVVLAWLAADMKRATAKVQTELDQAMSKLAQQAVASARAKGIDLDFSPNSVQGVETLLAQLHEVNLAGKLTDDQITDQATLWGAYVGEVIRRSEGGKWSCNHDVAGANTYPLSHARGEDFPVMWCGKRIVNGPQDNVWTKFKSQ